MTSALPLFSPMPWDDAELREEVEGEFKDLQRADWTHLLRYVMRPVVLRTKKKHLKPHRPPACAQCKKPIITKKKLTKPRQFCSVRCRHKFRRNTKKIQGPTHCKKCGVPITQSGKGRFRKFCSQRCSSKWTGRDDVKEDHQGRRPEGAGQEGGDDANPR